MIHLMYLIRLMYLIQILYTLDTDTVLDTANVRLDTEHPPSYGSSTVNVLTSTTKLMLSQAAFMALHLRTVGTHALVHIDNGVLHGLNTLQQKN